MKKVRDQVRQAVSAQTVVDDRERDSVAEFLVRFDQLDRPFDESAGPIHVTGSAIVLGTRGIVMHLHKRLHRWLQPGGHIDPDETPWDAAWRETLEETGLRVRHANDEPTLIHVDVHPGPRGHTHLDLRYLFFGDDSDPSPPPGESQDVRWFAVEDALMLVDDSLSGLFGLLQNRMEAGLLDPHRQLYVKNSPPFTISRQT